MYGPDLLGPGGGGFSNSFPPDFDSLYGVQLRGPGRGGYGPDFFVTPSGEVITPFVPLDIPPALLTAVAYSKGLPRSLAPAFSFGLTTPLPVSVEVATAKSVQKAAGTHMTWNKLRPVASNTPISSGFTLPKNVPVSARWRSLELTSVNTGIQWDDGKPMATVRTVLWRNATPVNPIWASDWQDAAPTEEAFGLPFLHLPGTTIPYDVRWGFGRPPPTIWKPPAVYNPDVNPPPAPPPVYEPPPGDQVALPFVCDLVVPPGDQVELPFRRHQCLLRSFEVENDITITRVDTGEAVTASTVRLAGDLESFAYTFSASVPRETGLELVNPIDGPVEVEVNINGQAFLCIVESWVDDRSWSNARRDEISIQGRSVVVELDEPYTEPRNYPRGSGDTAPLTMVGRMDEELEFTGWTVLLDPELVNWTIPPGVLNYSGLTPIRAVALIAQATGAVVQPVPDARQLKIMPRFPAKPWALTAAPSTVEIQYSVVSAERGQWLANRQASPRLGIYIEGEQNGAAAEVRIDGTAGEWAEPVLEPLCTDTQVARLRGITELGQSWRAALVGLQIPMGTQGAHTAGWIAPGQVAQVFETASDSWKAVTIGWELAGRWDETTGLVVEQQVTLERYLEPSPP